MEQVNEWDEAKQRNAHARRFENQDFRIISYDNVDVGVVALEATHRCMKLNQMLLLPDFQGRGLGRASMKLIQQEAQALCLAIRLKVLRVNPRARSFYESLGFRRNGVTDTHDLLEWECHPNEPAS